MMQKFGKSDQTKDEVYEEFVVNFNKQNVSPILPLSLLAPVLPHSLPILSPLHPTSQLTPLSLY